jgi:hypothetical protein
MPSAGVEPAIPDIKRLQTNALDLHRLIKFADVISTHS